MGDGLTGWVAKRGKALAVENLSEDARSQAHDWLSKAILAGSAVSVIGLFIRLQFDQMLVGSLAVLFWVLLAMAILSYPSYNLAVKGILTQRSGAVTEI